MKRAFSASKRSPSGSARSGHSRKNSPLPGSQVFGRETPPPGGVQFAPVQLLMRPGKQVKVTVASAETDQPIEGAEVSLGYPDRRKATTGSDGVATLRRTPPRQVRDHGPRRRPCAEERERRPRVFLSRHSSFRSHCTQGVSCRGRSRTRTSAPGRGRCDLPFRGEYVWVLRAVADYGRARALSQRTLAPGNPDRDLLQHEDYLPARKW